MGRNSDNRKTSAAASSACAEGQLPPGGATGTSGHMSP